MTEKKKRQDLMPVKVALEVLGHELGELEAFIRQTKTKHLGDSKLFTESVASVVSKIRTECKQQRNVDNYLSRVIDRFFERAKERDERVRLSPDISDIIAKTAKKEPIDCEESGDS